MQLKPLGSTNIQVSPLAFGAGPISGLMNSEQRDLQCETLQRALDAGINWIDTAATYGNGQSESSLGQALQTLNATGHFHIATKVRLDTADTTNIPTQIRRSVIKSLERLGIPRITLLQLHNSITARRDDEPTSVTAEDVLGDVVETFQKLQQEGLVEHLGLTAIGQPAALRRAINSGQFATIQVPYNILNPSAGQTMPAGFAETNYGNIISDCANSKNGRLCHPRLRRRCPRRSST